MTAITFIDTSLENHAELAAAVGTEVILVDAARDGLAQVAAALAGRTGIDAIHVLGHGAAGLLALGTARVTLHTLDDYASELATIRSALAEEADLLLYGCDIARSGEGQALIGALAHATGADVAASTNPTGSALLGGDWTLEASAGRTEAATLDGGSLASYGGVLTLAQEVTTFAGVSAGYLEPQRDSGPAGTAITAVDAAGSGWDLSFVSGGTSTVSTSIRGVNANGAGAEDASAIQLTGNDGKVKIMANEAVTFDFSAIHFDTVGSGTVRIHALDAAGNVIDPLAGYIDTVIPAGTSGYRDSAAAAGNPAFDDISGIQFEWLADWSLPGTSSHTLYLDTIRVTDIRAANTAPSIAGIASTAWRVEAGRASALPDFTVADADGDTLTVTLAPTGGTIGGVADADPAAAGIQLTGTAAQVSAALAAATFTAAASGAATIDVGVTDGAAGAAAALHFDAVDVTPPALVHAAVNGASLVMTYDEAPDALAIPDTGAFTVMVDGALCAVTAVTVGSAGRTVTLALAAPVQAGQGVTVAYTDPTAGDDSAAIQDMAGNDAATLPATPATNATADDVPPRVLSIGRQAPADAVTGADSLTWRITFDGPVDGLDEADLTVSGTTAAVTNIAWAGGHAWDVTVSGGDLADLDGIVTLGFAAGHDVRDAAGNVLVTTPAGINDATFTLRNGEPPLDADSAAPTFAAASVNGNRLTLTYADASALDADRAPVPGAFAVTAAGRALAVAGVAVDAAGKAVTLTLASSVAHGQAVTVAYTDPGAGDDPYAIQDLAGNDAATLGATPVLNSTPAPPGKGGTVPVVIDGVAVQTGRVTHADGSTATLVTIPIVTPDRKEQVGDASMADIALASSGAAAVLTAQLPAGYGLAATGAGVATAGSAAANLIRAIEAHTAAGSVDRAQLASGGAGFLAGLPAAAELLVEAVVPVAAAGPAPARPLVIAGTPDVATALVIDARGLPGGSAMHLQDVRFAAVIGAVAIAGAGGAQSVWGDGADQVFVLGAGDDTMSGGLGDDRLDGGAGADVARFSGASRADYSLRVHDGQLVMTHLRGADGTDTVAGVETLRFAPGAADTGVRGTVARLVEATTGGTADALAMDRWLALAGDGSGKGSVAAALAAALDDLDTGAFVDALYRNALHRDADVAGKAFWSAVLDSNAASRGEVALGFADSAEKLALAEPLDLVFDDSDVALLVRMYGALFGRRPDEGGLNHWIGVHESGQALADIADAFIASAEAAARYGAVDDGDFVDALYRTSLDRAAEGDGKSFWSGALEAGTIDRGDVLLGFAGSAELAALVGRIDTSIATM